MNCTDKQKEFIISIISNQHKRKDYKYFDDIYNYYKGEGKYKHITFRSNMLDLLKPMTLLEAQNFIGAYHFEEIGRGGVNIKNARKAIEKLNLMQ